MHGMRRWTIVGAAAAAALLATETAAQETPRDTTATAVDSLRARMAELELRLRRQDEERSGAAESAAEEEGYRVDFGGYGSFRLDGSDLHEDDPSFTLRRFVLTTDARLAGRLQVYSEIEFERFAEIEVEREMERTAGGVLFEQELEGQGGSELSLEQAWAQFDVTPALGLRFGAVLPPVGRFNLNHDDNLWNFARRPLIDRAAQVLPGPAAWTEMGLGVVGGTYVGGVRLGYQAYVLNGTTLDFAVEEIVQTRDPSRNKLELEAVVSPTSGAFDGSNAADAVAARFEVSPALGSEFAVSGYHGVYTPEIIEDADGRITTLGVDGRQKVGPFYVEGEFLYTHYSNVDRVLTEFAAAVGSHAAETEADETADLESEIEVELTGLADDRYGFWVDLSRPFALRRGWLGLDDASLTPVARYERVWLDGDLDELDFDDGVVTETARADREQDRLSLGLAFRPVPQAVVSLTYERSHAYRGALIDPATEGGEETANGVVLGMAVGF